MWENRHNYYNYQIAVIFAILIAALLLLGAVVIGIYFVVSSMREKKSVKPGVARRIEWQPNVQPQYQQYSTVASHVQPIDEQAYVRRLSTGQHQVPTNEEVQQEQYQPQYYTEPTTGRIQELHPDYAYQQGPTTWTNVSVAQPQQHQQQGYAGQGPPTSSYHMSSV